MTITLRPEYEQLIEQAVQSGAYESVSQVIEEALEMLRVEDERLQDDRAALNKRIDDALERYDRGDFLTPEQSRADMERRKAAWLSSQR